MIERLGPVYAERRSQFIWLTIYSDLITNLFLLFLALYALSYMGPEAITAAVASMKNRLEYYRHATPWYEEITHGLKMAGDPDAPVVAREDRLQMALPEAVLFDPGDGELRMESQLILHALAQALRRVPYTILVEGHTDNSPLAPGSRYASNWDLSMARAMSVVRYLVHMEGLSPRRLGVAAFGEYHARFPNDSPEHRTMNRRIEISILRYE